MSGGGERVSLRSKYAYNAKHADELSFPADADMFLVEKRENGWWKGDYNGNVGLFPYNYVDVIPSAAAANAVPSPRTGSSGDPALKKAVPTFTDGKERAIALDDYTAKDSQQLDFKKDDIIIIVQKFPTGWWKGDIGGRQGVFPQKTVKLLADLKDEEKGKKHKRGRSGTSRDGGSRKRASSKSRTNTNSGTSSPALAPPPGEDAAGSTESSFDGSNDDENSSEEQSAFGFGSAVVRFCSLSVGFISTFWSLRGTSNHTISPDESVSSLRIFPVGPSLHSFVVASPFSGGLVFGSSFQTPVVCVTFGFGF